MTEKNIGNAKENESDSESVDVVVDVEFKHTQRSLTKPAVMDTGAFSTWIDAELSKRLGGKLIEDMNGARDASGGSCLSMEKDTSISRSGAVEFMSRRFWL